MSERAPSGPVFFLYKEAATNRFMFVQQKSITLHNRRLIFLIGGTKFNVLFSLSSLRKELSNTPEVAQLVCG